MDSTRQELDSKLPFERIIERLELCLYTVQETHYEIEPLETPDQKADLLIAVENLTSEVIDLLRTTQLLVWGPEEEHQEEE